MEQGPGCAQAACWRCGRPRVPLAEVWSARRYADSLEPQPLIWKFLISALIYLAEFESAPPLAPRKLIKTLIESIVLTHDVRRGGVTAAVG